MCFYYDGTSDFYVSKIVTGKKPHQCGECFREIPAGELSQHVTQKFDGDLLSDYYCGECEATRFRIHLKELAEGCRGVETWCPVGHLADYCHEMEIKRSTHRGGQLYFRKLKREQTALKAARKSQRALATS